MQNFIIFIPNALICETILRIFKLLPIIKCSVFCTNRYSSLIIFKALIFNFYYIFET